MKSNERRSTVTGGRFLTTGLRFAGAILIPTMVCMAQYRATKSLGVGGFVVIHVGFEALLLAIVSALGVVIYLEIERFRRKRRNGDERKLTHVGAADETCRVGTASERNRRAEDGSGVSKKASLFFAQEAPDTSEKRSS